MGLKILGTGSALPEKVVTNFDLMKTMDTSDEWIRERTGIGARHVVTGSFDTETTLGTNAARRAIEAAGLLACDIDLILVATCTADDRLPCVACKIQAALGAGQAAAFDINAACAGFLIGLSVAEGYLSSGAFANVLVIGTETVSKIIDWSDRGSAILFGDGAGACVVTRSDSAFTFALGADGEGGNALRCSHNSTVTMDGQAVYRFATRTVP
ncbi:MAG: 3-oxoacyl-ACP synthase, partial [Lachnospiraceae bacterium]|nr:3-oxoacyl-ACP synthase [Lachnospiraceae bacterium]